MYRMLRASAVLIAFLLNVGVLRAQTAPDPSGHWEGIVQVPGMDVAFELDFAKNSTGVAGTVGIPAQKLSGLPLRSVVVDGRSIKFQARTDQSFDGTIAEDGGSISGSYYVDGAAVPFTMTRKGEARITPPVTSAPIGRELEGRWTATSARGTRLELTMENRPDGTATGIIANLNEGGLQIPVKIVQDGVRVTLDVAVLGGSYAATLNASGTELSGTYTDASQSAPLTFTRSGAAKP